MVNLEELLGRRGIGEGVSEGLPMLREHASTWVGDFDTIVRNLVVGGCYHDTNHCLGLQ